MNEKNIAHYEILEKRGEGGMGCVYLAHDPRLQRKVAIKVLAEDLTQDPSYRQRFLTEARSASALNHSNVVTIYEIGSDEGRDFIAMEYVEGRDLQSVISERGRLPLDELLEIGRQLAAGVAAAHRAGILHRDLKPANVILTPDGNVKILDFGLAKRQEPEAAPAPEADLDPSVPGPTVVVGQTTPGMIIGTPGFMSPEKARGKSGDHRSDIFSLGCILYVLATGKSPFVGDSVIDVLHNVLHLEPDAVDSVRSDLPVELQTILRRCLEKEPENRYADASELEKALRDVQLTLQSGSLSPAAGLQAGTRSARRRAPLAAACSAVMVLALAVIYLLFKADSGVATTTVTVKDEEGQQIQREIPTREFRKRLAILPFVVAGGDTSQSWLAYAAT
ncbi:MAG: serine/threonine-protein kinase, partial [bacterium]